MLPILLSVGPIKIYSYGVFLALGLFVGLYFWWKMGRDEHLDEIELFDGYFLSLIVFFVTSRIAYVIAHPDLQTWYRAIALLAYPGMLVSTGIVFVMLYLYLYARMREWESFKIMDMASVVLSSVILIGSIGAILNGSNPGVASPWGVVNVDIWTFIWGLATFGIVSRVRKQFRFYAWYKGEASVARDGLAIFCFCPPVRGIYDSAWICGRYYVANLGGAWGDLAWSPSYPGIFAGNLLAIRKRTCGQPATIG
jgi:Prolipoprotein diacylglyceryltransferase